MNMKTNLLILLLVSLTMSFVFAQDNSSISKSINVKNDTIDLSDEKNSNNLENDTAEDEIEEVVEEKKSILFPVNLQGSWIVELMSTDGGKTAGLAKNALGWDLPNHKLCIIYPDKMVDQFNEEFNVTKIEFPSNNPQKYYAIFYIGNTNKWIVNYQNNSKILLKIYEIQEDDSEIETSRFQIKIKRLIKTSMGLMENND